MCPATGPDRVAGFQKRADQNSRATDVAPGQGRGKPSLAALVARGGKIGLARGGNRPRIDGVQPPGKGIAKGAGGESERGGHPLHGIFSQRTECPDHLENRVGGGTVSWRVLL